MFFVLDEADDSATGVKYQRIKRRIRLKAAQRPDNGQTTQPSNVNADL